MKKTYGSKPEGLHESLFLIEEEDIFSDLTDKKGTSLFLGKYMEKVVLEIFDKNGFFKKVQKEGLWPLDYELDSSAFPPLQKVLVFYKTKKPENIIMEFRIKERTFRFKNGLPTTISYSKFNFLSLEWLTIQNPLHRFSREKPPLPGQTYPGLNLGRGTVDIFADLGKLNHNNGLMAFPAFFHIALIIFPRCRFINPQKMGEVLAIWKTFGKMELGKLAWVVHLECLNRDDGRVYKWTSEEMVFPMCRELKKYFRSRTYKREVKEAMKRHTYTVDWEKFKRKFEEEMSSLESESNPMHSS